MSKSVNRQLLSAYLDGELGLADKQALEAVLREDAELRAEYHELRRIGLELGASLGEVRVHPYRFRQRLASSIDQRQALFITPQRAFTAAMSVALMVVSITFGLFIYQQRLIGQGGVISLGEAQRVHQQSRSPQYGATLVVETTPDQFYSRLLIETQLGMMDANLASRLLLQSGVMEGATCVVGLGLNSVVFPQRLPSRTSARLSLAELQRLQRFADGMTSSPNALAISSIEGRLITQQDYLLSFPSGAELPVELIFQQ